jgi:hypothetical protein
MTAVEYFRRKGLRSDEGWARQLDRHMLLADVACHLHLRFRREEQMAGGGGGASIDCPETQVGYLDTTNPACMSLDTLEVAIYEKSGRAKRAEIKLMAALAMFATLRKRASTQEARHKLHGLARFLEKVKKTMQDPTVQEQVVGLGDSLAAFARLDLTAEQRTSALHADRPKTWSDRISGAVSSAWEALKSVGKELWSATKSVVSKIWEYRKVLSPFAAAAASLYGYMTVCESAAASAWGGESYSVAALPCKVIRNVVYNIMGWFAWARKSAAPAAPAPAAPAPAAPAPAATLASYRAIYPEVKIYDGIVYKCILAKEGMPYVLLIGERHNVLCKDTSRVISHPEVVRELLRPGDHFLLEDLPPEPKDVANIQQLIHYVRDTSSSPVPLDQLSRMFRQRRSPPNVQFHWLDYGWGWLDFEADQRADKRRRACAAMKQPDECRKDPLCVWSGVTCHSLPMGLQAIPDYPDFLQLIGGEEVDAPAAILERTLISALLDTDTCKVDQKTCEDVGHSKDYITGSCVWDTVDATCRSIFGHIHRELEKEKCAGYQPVTADVLASELVQCLMQEKDKSYSSLNFSALRWTMDVYSLFRMFRKFRTPAKRCIVYAGDFHSINLRHLLVGTQGYRVLEDGYFKLTDRLSADEPCQAFVL